jgi:hypothetical protein
MNIPDINLEPEPQPRGYNWQLYFYEFCEKHGRPMQLWGVQVFPDGFTYSATDYAGPEWRPPNDPHELRKLLLGYWSKLASLCKIELKKAERELANIELTQAERAAPLQHEWGEWDAAAGCYRAKRGELDLGGFQVRVTDRRMEYEYAASNVERLKHGEWALSMMEWQDLRKQQEDEAA